MVDIVPFHKWAGQPLPNLPSIPLPSSELWLHHGAAGVSTVPTLRAYLNHHVRNNGWTTIGYSFGIADGQVYECRGPGRRGAHTYGRNHLSHGIVMAGNYTHRPPSDADLDALVWLLRHGHQKRWWRHPQLSGGHRDAPGASSACPGDALHRLIPDINRRARSAPDQGDIMTPEQERRLAKVEQDVAWIRRALGSRYNPDDQGPGIQLTVGHDLKTVRLQTDGDDA